MRVRKESPWYIQQSIIFGYTLHVSCFIMQGISKHLHCCQEDKQWLPDPYCNFSDVLTSDPLGWRLKWHRHLPCHGPVQELVLFTRLGKTYESYAIVMTDCADQDFQLLICKHSICGMFWVNRIIWDEAAFIGLCNSLRICGSRTGHLHSSIHVPSIIWKAIYRT
jgi:hypothetical protein